MSVPPLSSPVTGTRFRLAEVAETISTNVDLNDLVAVGEEPYLALRADFQSVGRGRRDRTWDAPPESGLMMSVLFPAVREDIAVDAHRVASCLGLAAFRACRAYGADVSMKWPNDLVGKVLDDGALPKLAGVLGEVVTRGSETLGIVVGIGLNLRAVPARAAALGRGVVVLDELTDRQIMPTEMARETLRRLERILARLEQDAGSEWLKGELVSASIIVGREVEIATDAGVISGLAVDIDLEGRLVIETIVGSQSLSVGDVVSARITG